MIKTKETVTTTTSRKHEHVVTGECFRHMLSQLLGKEVPPYAEITVHVPGGGDWSNTDLDINDHPIHVTWTVVTRG
jgi:hypothetical protein